MQALRSIVRLLQDATYIQLQASSSSLSKRSVLSLALKLVLLPGCEPPELSPAMTVEEDACSDSAAMSCMIVDYSCGIYLFRFVFAREPHFEPSVRIFVHLFSFLK